MRPIPFHFCLIFSLHFTKRGGWLSLTRSIIRREWTDESVGLAAFESRRWGERIIDRQMLFNYMLWICCWPAVWRKLDLSTVEIDSIVGRWTQPVHYFLIYFHFDWFNIFVELKSIHVVFETFHQNIERNVIFFPSISNLAAHLIGWLSVLRNTYKHQWRSFRWLIDDKRMRRLLFISFF